MWSWLRLMKTGLWFIMPCRMAKAYVSAKAMKEAWISCGPVG